MGDKRVPPRKLTQTTSPSTSASSSGSLTINGRAMSVATVRGGEPRASRVVSEPPTIVAQGFVQIGSRRVRVPEGGLLGAQQLAGRVSKSPSKSKQAPAVSQSKKTPSSANASAAKGGMTRPTDAVQMTSKVWERMGALAGDVWGAVERSVTPSEEKLQDILHKEGLGYTTTKQLEDARNRILQAKRELIARLNDLPQQDRTIAYARRTGAFERYERQLEYFDQEIRDRSRRRMPASDAPARSQATAAQAEATRVSSDSGATTTTSTRGASKGRPNAATMAQMLQRNPTSSTRDSFDATDENRSRGRPNEKDEVEYEGVLNAKPRGTYDSTDSDESES